MGKGIEFDEKEAAETERSYLTAEIVETRRVVMELLALRPGERVLDVGSGPGLLLCNIAEAVGPDGLAAGIDISESMVTIARNRCASLTNVELTAGNATSLPWPEAAFDCAVSTQVYEYVPDLAAAFAELHRVLKPGGRAVLMATDSDSIRCGPADDPTAEKIRAAWPPHCAHPFLPREMPALLAAAGFVVRDRQVHVLRNSRFDADHFGWYMARAMSHYAARQGAIGKEEGKAWIARLRALEASGGFTFSLTRDLVTAEKPAG